MREETRRMIEALVKTNPGQMVAEEYSAVAEELLARGPCSFLVWGVGNDTALWLEANKGGHTRFIEHSPRWIGHALKRAPAAVIHQVEYSTKLTDVAHLLESPIPRMVLPAEISERRWDVVLVDSPQGEGRGAPGRMQSIYETSLLVAVDARVFVHDVHRKVETLFSSRFLGEQVKRVVKLGVYDAKARRPAP